MQYAPHAKWPHQPPNYGNGMVAGAAAPGGGGGGGFGPGVGGAGLMRGALDKAQLDNIEDAIHQIYMKNSSKLSYQSLYTMGYHIVSNKQGEQLYSHVERIIQKHIVAHCEELKTKYDDQFLDALLLLWEQHCSAFKMIHDIFLYMDKHYVAESNKQPVRELGVKLFGECLLKEARVMVRFRQHTLELITKQRDKVSNPTSITLHALTRMLISIDRTGVYEPLLEQPYLRASEAYFQNDAEVASCERSVPDYIHHVFARLREERDRAEQSLDASTVPKIEAIVRQCMIVKYKELLLHKEGSGCASMLSQWREDDLRQLFRCLLLVKDTAPMVSLVAVSYLDNGRAIFNVPAPNAVNLIDQFIALRERYRKLLRTSFLVHDGTRERVDPHCEAMVERATEDILNSKDFVAEFLATYADFKMRNRDEEDSFETACNNVLQLLKYVRDKDLFEQCYKVYMARRLLASKAVSEDMERTFITKLKQEHSCSFTSKMEAMFLDTRKSPDLMEDFRKRMEAQNVRLPLDLNVTVITTGIWPVTAPATTATIANMPRELKQCIDVFTRFYLKLKSGRTLTFHDSLGSADVRFTLAARKFELSVSTPQMLLLCALNGRDAISFGDLAEAMGFKTQELLPSLAPLCGATQSHTRLLHLPEGVTPATLKSDHMIKVNMDFKSKHVKLRFAAAATTVHEKEEESKDMRTRVNEERKWVVDSVLVRIMKSRRTMEHSNLVSEAIDLLKQRFRPSPDEIKRRIESLIERDYMERSAESRTRYNYLS
eukprot:PhM_4_TR4506/c0_g1_i1/m.7735/K03869/CUL3; cullin 3